MARIKITCISGSVSPSASRKWATAVWFLGREYPSFCSVIGAGHVVGEESAAAKQHTTAMVASTWSYVAFHIELVIACESLETLSSLIS